MEVKSPDDWMDGFVAGFALATGHYPLYDERIAGYLAMKSEQNKTSPYRDSKE